MSSMILHISLYCSTSSSLSSRDQPPPLKSITSALGTYKRNYSTLFPQKTPDDVAFLNSFRPDSDERPVPLPSARGDVKLSRPCIVFFFPLFLPPLPPLSTRGLSPDDTLLNMSSEPTELLPLALLADLCAPSYDFKRASFSRELI